MGIEIGRLRAATTAADDREPREKMQSADSLISAAFGITGRKSMMAWLDEIAAQRNTDLTAHLKQERRASDLCAPSYQRLRASDLYTPGHFLPADVSRQPPAATTLNITINVTSDAPADSESQEPQRLNEKEINGDQS